MKFELGLNIYRVYVDVYVYSDISDLSQINNELSLLCKVHEDDLEEVFSGAARTYPMYTDDDELRRIPVVFNESWMSAGTVAHEAFHIVYRVLASIGPTNITEDTEEFWAYPIQYLVDGILLNYEERKEIKK